MQYIVYVYIGIFALLSLGMCVGELLADPSERDPIWETVCDIAAAGVFLAGMIFFVVGTDSQALKAVWLILAPLAGAYVVISSLRARKKQMIATTPEDKRSDFEFADIGTIAFVIPALAINILFSLQGPSTTQSIEGEQGGGGQPATRSESK